VDSSILLGIMLTFRDVEKCMRYEGAKELDDLNCGKWV
jgi:hypothetical protein